MKKTFSLLVAINFIFCYANGQITQGNWLVGGTSKISSDKNSVNNETISNIQISPNIGYFIWDNLAAGMKLNILFMRHALPSSSGTGYINTNDISAGPFARYYFLKNENSINIFLEGSYAYGKYTSAGYYQIVGGQKSSFLFSGGPVFYFNSSVGIEIAAGYYNNNDITAKVINHGFQLAIALQVHLTK